MFDKWHKKEKPVFTGISRGVGGFSFGVPSAGGGGGSSNGSGSASGATLSPLADGVASGDFKFFGFTAPGTFTVANGPVYADILVIGGGGAGAGAPDGNGAGGGGAGGVVMLPGIELETGTYPVTVGGGGLSDSGGGNVYPNDNAARNGSSSLFGSSPSPTYVVAGGGGRGAQGVDGPNSNSEADGAGSGGGGASPSPGPFREGHQGQIGDNTTTGRLVREYANPGCRSAGSASSGGWGGGGGAGSMGNTAPPGGGGRGGAFTRINEFPAPVTEPLIPAPTRSAWTAAVGPQGCFGAGGGGGSWNMPSFTPRGGYPNSIPGGKGGYGAGSPGTGSQGTAGVEFTGSGGGGSGPGPNNNPWAGGKGGDGIVLIRQVVKTGFSYISATGGDANDTREGYKYHYFTTTGPQTFTINSGSGMVEYFAVGGGGGGGGAPTGGADGGGGGGAGGVLEGSKYCESGDSFTFVVGAGGATNVDGVDTTLFGLTAMKGGRGSSGPNKGANGGSGYGSGGGGSAAGNSGGAQDPGAADPSNQGFRGGGSAAGGGPGGGGAGGGGAGGDGASSHGPWGFRDTGSDGLANGSNTYGGPGGYGIVCGFPLPGSYGDNIPSDQSRGNGYPSDFRGFAGGGGGGNWTSMPERGHGGQGNRVVNNSSSTPYYGGGGGANHNSAGSPGVANTGGGGGGGGQPSAGGYAGGPGIIIVRYQVS